MIVADVNENLNYGVVMRTEVRENSKKLFLFSTTILVSLDKRWTNSE